MIDYPWVRPYPWYQKIFAPDTTAEHDRDLMAQAIIDLRRAFDVLLSRPKIDPNRIGYVGHSYGSEFGAVLAAIDHRMAACVLIAGYPTEASIWLESNDPQIAEMRKAAGIPSFPSYVRNHSQLRADSGGQVTWTTEVWPLSNHF